MDGGLVAIARIFVGLARSKMQGAGDLLIEQDVAHRVQDEGIEPEAELADGPGSGIHIEDLVELALGAALTGGLDDTTLLQFQTDALELGARVQGGRVEGDHAVGRLERWAAEALAIGNVAQALAGLSSDVLDGEGEVGARSH